MQSLGYSTDSMITMKLNPTQLLALFMLPIAYDMDTMSTHVTRITDPTAYEIAFDDYVRFIALETVPKLETSSMFLASDSVLNKCARDILPLINHLGDGNPETLRDRSFSAISDTVKRSLHTLYNNFILNMTMLQIKMIEFLRWDTGKGSHVAYIIPTLGVFEALKNIKEIEFIHEDDGKDIELRQVNQVSQTIVPSNIKVGVLDKSIAEYLFENTEPRLLIDSYLYRGIYKYSEPLGRILPEAQREELEAKSRAYNSYQNKIRNAEIELNTVISKNNLTDQDDSTFLSEVVEEVQRCISQGIRPKQAMSTIYNKYETLTELLTNPNRPPELTDKEKALMERLNEVNLRRNTQWVTKQDKARNRLVDRYPKYCYYELVSKLEMKLYNEEQLEPLEESILEVDVWINLLLRLLDLCEDLYNLDGETYLLTYDISQTYTDSIHADYKLEGYNLTNVLP